VLTSSPANALQPYLQNDNDWDQGQIFFTSDLVWGMPPFYSQKMQAENHLPLRIQSTVQGALDVTATCSEDGKTLILHVVNTSTDSIYTNILLRGFEGRKPETDILMLSGEPNPGNATENPAQHKTVKLKIMLTEKDPTYNFPPQSYTILKFERNHT
jgi:alpha-L-arabinofuranosidase